VSGVLYVSLQLCRRALPRVIAVVQPSRTGRCRRVPCMQGPAGHMRHHRARGGRHRSVEGLGTGPAPASHVRRPAHRSVRAGELRSLMGARREIAARDRCSKLVPSFCLALSAATLPPPPPPPPPQPQPSTPNPQPQVKTLFVGKDHVGDVPLTMKIAAGLATGAIGISVASPTDLVKVRCAH